MFPKELYLERRNRLRKELKSGIVLFPGNQEVAYNYLANGYTFRQDSHFSYFFGLDQPGFAGLIDVESGKEYIFGNDVDIEDIIWMGEMPGVSEMASEVGVIHTAPYKDLTDFLRSARSSGRTIHYLPPYRGETMIELADWLDIPLKSLREKASISLIKAVVKLKEVKDAFEIAEIEKAVNIAYLMHTTAMKMCQPGVIEQEISGTIEGISLALGGPVSFPVILSMNGHIFHNHEHGNALTPGRMVVIDAGAETQMGYASDITRSVPVGGVFNQRQKEIYQAVLDANMAVIEHLKPGIRYYDMHMMAAKILTKGLKEIGLMKGDVDEAVAAGAHTLFLPHGLGHMMGMDVHDLEGVGENHVGYDETIQRSGQFGTAYLRLAKTLKPGFVLTVEPGCYFIPALFRQFRAEGKFKDFIHYDLVEKYLDFGGIRIEDDVLITETGHKVLGKPIPKSVKEVENTAAEPLEWVTKGFLA